MSPNDNDRDYQDRALDVQERAHRVSVKLLKWTVLINLPLSLATLALAAYTYNIAISTRDIRNASIAANELTRENFAKQFRAYLSKTQNLKVTKTASNVTVNAFDIQYGIKNFGQSPGLQVTAQLEQMMIPTGSQSGDVAYHSEAPDECSPNPHDQSVVLSAGEEMFYHVQRKQFVDNPDSSKTRIFGSRNVDEFSQSVSSSFDAGKSILIMTGTICYQDIFNIKHVTHFCDQIKNKDDYLNLIATPCPDGNSAN